METFSEAKGYPADMFINSEEALEMVSKDTLVMVVTPTGQATQSVLSSSERQER